jgi:hypothetical protein
MNDDVLTDERLAEIEAEFCPAQGVTREPSHGVPALVAEVRRLRAELAESNLEHDHIIALVGAQKDVLTATANALKGAPTALSAHSHHDLDLVAARVIAERDEARAEVERLRAAAPKPRTDAEGWDANGAPTR